MDAQKDPPQDRRILRRTLRMLRLGAKETNSVGPLPFSRQLGQLKERAGLPADISGRNGFLIDEDDAAMVAVFLRPPFQQWRNGSSIVGNEGQLPNSSVLEKKGVVDAEEASTLPLGQCVNDQLRVPAAYSCRHLRRYVLIEKQLEHGRAFLRCRSRPDSLAAACA